MSRTISLAKRSHANLMYNLLLSMNAKQFSGQGSFSVTLRANVVVLASTGMNTVATLLHMIGEVVDERTDLGRFTVVAMRHTVADTQVTVTF